MCLGNPYCDDGIIKATEVTPHQYPFAARAFIRSVGRPGICGEIFCGQCGVSVVNCCVHKGTTVPIDPADIRFNIGAHFDQTCSFSNLCCIYEGEHRSVTGTVVETNEIIVHPSYNKGLDWDFCLAKVEKMNIDGTTVKVVRFPDAHIAPSIVTVGEKSVARNQCLVMSWGETERGVQSATLLAASVEIMSDSYCKTFPGKYSRMNPTFEFCAGKRHNPKSFYNEDSCSGDSGGPLHGLFFEA